MAGTVRVYPLPKFSVSVALLGAEIAKCVRGGVLYGPTCRGRNYQTFSSECVKNALTIFIGAQLKHFQSRVWAFLYVLQIEPDRQPLCIHT